MRQNDAAVSVRDEEGIGLIRMSEHPPLQRVIGARPRVNNLSMSAVRHTALTVPPLGNGDYAEIPIMCMKFWL